MHVLTGLRAGARCGSAHSGAAWTPPTARGMPKRVRKAGRRLAVLPARRAVLARELSALHPLVADGGGWGGNQGPTFSAQDVTL